MDGIMLINVQNMCKAMYPSIAKYNIEISWIIFMLISSYKISKGINCKIFLRFLMKIIYSLNVYIFGIRFIVAILFAFEVLSTSVDFIVTDSTDIICYADFN